MLIEMIKLEFTTVRFNVSDLPKLRGFFSSHFSENIEFHNHLPDGSFSYKYPVIQYRIIKGHPALIGVKEGIEVSGMKSIVEKILDDEISPKTWWLNIRIENLRKGKIAENGEVE